MRVLAIDPGGMTGLALLDDSGVIAVSTTDVREDIWRLISDSDLDVVVIEDFHTAGRISKHGLWTVRLIGSLEALCWRKSLILVKQAPAYRYQCLGQARRLVPGGGGIVMRHEYDALAHLLAWERESGDDGRPRGGAHSAPAHEVLRKPVTEL